MTLTPYFAVWSILALCVLGLALYRKLIAMREDDLIHISDAEGKMIPKQIAMAHKLDDVDRWGKILTIATVALGFLLASIYLYQVYLESLKPAN
jgi:hypothetical protein